MKTARGVVKLKDVYEKPGIEEIELFMEEVLALGCKVGTASAPLTSVCAASSCFYEGS